jgi:hypothetical protein
MNYIIAGISAILNQNHYLHIECQTGGGWESWLQVELHRWLLQSGSPMSVGREVQCYAAPHGGLKCDLTLGPMAVELKAMGLNRASAGFVTLVTNDIAKIKRPLIPGTNSAHLAVVIPNAQKTATARAAVNALGPTSVIPAECGCYTIYVFL